MKALPRILKIIDVTEEGSIACVFNNGEYRLVSLAKFVEDHKLEGSVQLRRLLINPNELRQVEVVDGTLSFPTIKQTVELSDGQSFSVAYDLDPIMLYESSVEDVERERANQIGGQLRAARKRVGITQEELASRVGTSKGYISRIENNRSDIELSTLRRIVEVGLDKRVAITD